MSGGILNFDVSGTTPVSGPVRTIRLLNASGIGATGPAGTAGGKLFGTAAAVNGGDAVEVNMASYVMPASTLAVDGDSITITAFGVTSSDGSDTKPVRLYFGSTLLLDSDDVALGGFGPGPDDVWRIEATLIRENSFNSKAVIRFTSDSATSLTAGELMDVVTSITDSLGTAITIRLTGEGESGFGGTDVTMHGFSVRLTS